MVEKGHLLEFEATSSLTSRTVKSCLFQECFSEIMNAIRKCTENIAHNHPINV